MGDGTVLLTGASGLLGTWLRRSAPTGADVIGLTHRVRLADRRQVVADLRDPDAVTAALQRVRPSLVVHAAYARDEASVVAATRHVVEAARRVGADVVFVSTDAVFSGDGVAQHEDAPPSPVFDYGRWKAEAEQIVTAGSPGAAIVRLPLIVSLDPPDPAVVRITVGADRNQPTAWFDDEVRQPAAAADLAGALWRIAALDRDDRAGAWHLPGPESLSRFDIARRVVAALGLDGGTIVAEHAAATIARPRRIVLADERARRQLGWSPSPVLASVPGTPERPVTR